MAIFSPTEITDNYMRASVGKAASPAWRLFLLAVAAGVLIGLGAVTSSTAAHGLENAGLVRLMSGLIFPVGLMMVILMGTELFTGNALMVTAAIDGQITWGRLFRNWGIVFLGNLVGAVALAACMAFFGQLNIGGGDLAVYTAKVAAAKNALPWMPAVAAGGRPPVASVRLRRPATPLPDWGGPAGVGRGFSWNDGRRTDARRLTEEEQPWPSSAPPRSPTTT